MKLSTGLDLPLLLALLLFGLGGCTLLQPGPRPPIPAPTPAPPATRTAPASAGDAQRQAEFDQSLRRWHGAGSKELVAKLGPPTTSSRQADGSLLYRYVRTARLRGASGPSTFSCVVNYRIDAKTERIVGHSFEGC